MKVKELKAALAACDDEAEVEFEKEGDWGRDENGDSVFGGDVQSTISEVINLGKRVVLSAW